MKTTKSASIAMACSASSEEIRPFEWLTSASSLHPFLVSALERPSDEPRRVLHVGCGSSVLGEHLLEDQQYNVQQVVNVDEKGEMLGQMQDRWKRLHSLDDRLQFLEADFCTQPIDCTSGTFDLVVDKGTLDCTLCRDEASAGLITEVYRLLKPEGGVYLLVSFHHIDLLLPLLENLPGADWDVSHTILMREVEDLVTGGKTFKGKTYTPVEVPVDVPLQASAWSSGTFEPDEMYRRTVNVLQCRRRGGSTTSELDRTAVYQHINETNDHWFRSCNPMLTAKRKDELCAAFEELNLSLVASYHALFTDAERENLSYDLFMEDWDAFVEKNPELPVDQISYDTAVRFLDEMQ
jgi:SAM-dependent methyltransferase